MILISYKCHHHIPSPTKIGSCGFQVPDAVVQIGIGDCCIAILHHTIAFTSRINSVAVRHIGAAEIGYEMQSLLTSFSASIDPLAIPLAIRRSRETIYSIAIETCTSSCAELQQSRNYQQEQTDTRLHVGVRTVVGVAITLHSQCSCLQASVVRRYDERPCAWPRRKGLCSRFAVVSIS